MSPAQRVREPRVFQEDRARWTIVVLFALAMALMEAATVYYLRVMVDRVVPYQNDPLPIRADLGNIELWREAATLVMLATVGVLAGRSWPTRAGYSAIAFGVWDIFYYVFLRLMSGWPRSIFEWDILFLLPLPWWGPVIAPVCISVLMIAWGTLVTQSPARAGSQTRGAWTIAMLGVVIALYVFMADALHALDRGPEAVAQVLPRSFNWPLFIAALALMLASFGPRTRALTKKAHTLHDV